MVEQKSGNRFDKLLQYNQVKTLEVACEDQNQQGPFDSRISNQYAVSYPVYNYSQVNPREAELYKLLINTVGYIYCIDPATKTIRWILDKNYYHRVSKTDKNRLQFSFQDARDLASRNELVEFYTDHDIETFHDSLKDKK